MAAVVTREEVNRPARVRARAGSERKEARTATPPRTSTRVSTPIPMTAQSGCTATPRNGRTGPSGPRGERATATAPASNEPSRRAPREPRRLSHRHIGGSAPRARATSRSEERVLTRRLITWPAMSRAAIPVMPPKTLERDRLRAQRGVGGRDDVRGLGVHEGQPLRECGLHRRLHGREVPVAPLQGERADHVVAATGQELVRQGGGEEHDRLAVGVVLVLEQRGRLPGCDPDERHSRPLMSRDRLVRIEVARLGLRVGHPPDRDLLAHVVAQFLGAGRVHDDLVRLAGVDHPPLRDGDGVLVEVQPTHCGLGRRGRGLFRQRLPRAR